MEEMSEMRPTVYLSVTSPQFTHWHHPHITQDTLWRRNHRLQYNIRNSLIFTPLILLLAWDNRRRTVRQQKLYLVAVVCRDVAMRTRGCGLLDVKDVELGQLPMVTETRERSSPVDTAGQLRHWRERDTCSVGSRQLGRFAKEHQNLL